MTGRLKTLVQLRLTTVVALMWPYTTLAQQVSFDRDVAPILIDRCLECHSGSEPEGRLDLTGRTSAVKGGESGAAIIPGDPSGSLLLERVLIDEMPPSAPLTQEEKDVLRKWVAAGAKWPDGRIDRFSRSTANRAGRDWWAFQPLKQPTVPASETALNPIDFFVHRKLRAKGLSPSPRARPRELLRRLHFDLTGLPPTPEDVTKFQRDVQSNPVAAWRDAVESQLRSRHFGERWGRHWLDVVRFGESQGFERDKLRTNSWYYRDWVINALNNDMPYDAFVRHQIAGDLLRPNDHTAIIATGFLVAGPWDEVGQGQQSAAGRAVARQDELEDYVGTISQTFLGLTVNCARCHDHKFDPILQREYYQLASALGGVRHGSRPVNTPDAQARTAEIRQSIQQTRKAIDQIDASARMRLVRASNPQAKPLPARVSPIARWDFEKDIKDQIGRLHAAPNTRAGTDRGRLLLNRREGYVMTLPGKFPLREKTLEAWVRLSDLDQRAGAVMTIHRRSVVFDAIVYGEREPRKWMAGSDFFKRTQNLNAPLESETKQFVHLAIAYHADGMVACYRNGRPYGQPYQSDGPYEFQADDWFVMFGLRTGRPNPQRQLSGEVEVAQLYDRALTADEVAASWECEKASITHTDVLAALTRDERTQRQTLVRRMESARDELKNHAPYSVYAVVPKSPADVTSLLTRGNPTTPGERVTPGGVSSVPGPDSRFGLPADAPDSTRRRKLVEWITDKQNPLFARVIVNRLWYHHFGTGLVATPNDFGFNGGQPSHPELLDWLAGELISSGYSLKHIHRLIVSSATWQQASRTRADCTRVDADNRLLWRCSPRRLEAEALRDAMLSVAGQLNPRLGGPPYRDFTTTSNNSQFYAMVDTDTPDTRRRTVYRTWVRSARNHLLDAFDCPDPSTTAPKRAVTTTPIQALALLNSSFALRMSERFAERLETEAGSEVKQQTRRGLQLAFGRDPDPDEVAEAASYVDRFGLAAWCRIVFNSNEFIHVD